MFLLTSTDLGLSPDLGLGGATLLGAEAGLLSEFSDFLPDHLSEEPLLLSLDLALTYEDDDEKDDEFLLLPEV